MNWEVHAIVRKSSTLSVLTPIKDKVLTHQFDGSFESLSRIMSLANPNIVFHLASAFIPQHKSSDIDLILDSNIKFGTQLLEAMTINGVYKLINTGTSWQNYNDEIYNPVSLYAASKQAFQDIIEYYVKALKLRAVTLKLFDTYGPGDPRKKLIHLLMSLRNNGKELAMSPGEQFIDIVYVDDVIDAFIASADLLLRGDVPEHDEFAVSSGKVATLREVVKIFEEVCGEQLRIIWGAREYRYREVMFPWKTGVPVPGWVPNVQLKDGLKKIIEWQKVNNP